MIGSIILFLDSCQERHARVLHKHFFFKVCYFTCFVPLFVDALHIVSHVVGSAFVPQSPPGSHPRRQPSLSATMLPLPPRARAPWSPGPPRYYRQPGSGRIRQGD